VTQDNPKRTPEEAAAAKREYMKVYQKAWYIKNRDRLLANQKQYRVDNRDEKLAYNRAWRAANPEAAKAGQRAAYAKNAEYYKQRARDYYLANRERAAATNKAWADLNRDRVSLIKSRHKHRRRELEVANGVFAVTKRDARRLVEACGNACVYCRLPFGSDRPMTWDHIIPVSRGGVFSVGNLAPACGPCNSSKLNKTVIEWRAYQRRMEAAA
jgi:5-methylcytosine-specific restriction endonuclease McrA